MTNSFGQVTRLLDKDGKTVATVNVDRVREVVETLKRIQKVANSSAELWIAELADSKPNAFAISKDGKNYVFISITMFDLLGDDYPAYAFLFGHEVAHNVFGHGAQTQNRQGLLQGLSVLASVIVAAKTGVNVGGLSDFGASLIDRTFSRDQEREADKLGVEYMLSSGFDPQGALRLQRALMSITGQTTLPFLSTHPSGEERIANIENLIRGRSPNIHAIAASKEAGSSVAQTTFIRGQAQRTGISEDNLIRVADVLEKIRTVYLYPVENDKLVEGCRLQLLREARSIDYKVDGKTLDPGIGDGAMERVAEVVSHYTKKGDGGLNQKVAFDACIRGMLEGLDRQSSYYDEEEFRELQIGGTPLGAVGVELTMEDETPSVVRNIPNSPAERAGLQGGDRIVAIDGKATAGLTLRRVVKLLRGDVGSAVSLDVVRDGVANGMKLQMIREAIKIPPIAFKLIAPSYGYIQLKQFQAITPAAFAIAFIALTRDSGGKLNGLILDLRDNSGGYLPSVVGVASALLPAQALVVQTRGRSNDSNMRLTALPENYVRPGSGDDPLRNLPSLVKSIPVVVLVNDKTASGAELLAAALQDHKRAKVIGIRTFGNGSIATIFPLKNATGLKLTTATFLRPSGGRVDGVGIIPDITLDNIGPSMTGPKPTEDFALLEAVNAFDAKPTESTSR